MDYNPFSLPDIFDSHKHAFIEFLPVQQIFLYFIVYSFIGWICECVYVGTLERRVINRGFLRGPICPIYGCGGILLNMLPASIKESYVPLFFCTMILCSAVEYLTGWYLERTFHMKWWDYSSKKFNIKGRVCLLNSVLFGLLGIVVLHFVQPFIAWLVSSLSAMMTAIVANIIGVIFALDFVTTVNRLVDFKSMVEKMEELNERLYEQFADEIWFKALSIAEKFEAVKSHLKEVKDERHEKLLSHIEDVMQRQKRHAKFLTAFPSMTSRQHKAIVSMLKKSSESLSKKVIGIYESN